ncbi:substrate-binding domain-containing protein [Agromyces sp. PvR057]|uniref:substrate-binding domain-containing protein n=1 Tax=Agromyces sp. PvR057 TaxID=3156403 RepID=UPI003390BAA1
MTANRSFAGDADLDHANVAEVVDQWLARGVDGIVAYNDDIAATIIGAALRAGVAVPQQLKVVGHDDSPLASLFVPSLSSVRVDSAGLGRYLARLALSAATGSPPPAAGPDTDAVLILRETT